MRNDPDHAFDGLLSSWLLALDAAGKADKTLEDYSLGVRKLAAWWVEHQHADAPADAQVGDLTTEHLRTWLRDLADAGASENTVRNRYKAADLFLAWCVREGELDSNPMGRVDPPTVHEKVVQMLTPDQLRDLIASCDGPDFADRRDRAMLLMFADTGCRLSELTHMQVPELSLTEREVHVIGKGTRPRLLPFGATTAAAVDRYLRVRRRMKHAHTPALWLSANQKGSMTPSGVRQVITRRGRAVGVRVHPHMFRHGFADAWLAGGGSESDLMSLAGWRSRQMLNRYGAARHAARARESYRDRSPMDNLGS